MSPSVVGLCMARVRQCMHTTSQTGVYKCTVQFINELYSRVPGTVPGSMAGFTLDLPGVQMCTIYTTYRKCYSKKVSCWCQQSSHILFGIHSFNSESTKPRSKSTCAVVRIINLLRPLPLLPSILHEQNHGQNLEHTCDP